jgi:YesN/AraC family two-component response regulator
MIEDYEKSLEMLDKCLENNDKNIPAHSVKTICLLKLGRYDEVLNYFDQIPTEVIIPEEKTGVTALAYALKHDKAKAGEYFELVQEQSKGHNSVAAEAFIFMYYAVTGAVDKAFEWIENIPQNDASLLLLRFCDPMVSSLRNDPRYQQIKERIYQTDVVIDRVKKKKAILGKHQAAQFTNSLLDHIHKNQPYLNPDLSLRVLAEQLEIHPNQLSWLINEHLGKNFNDFINHYRVETFKSLAKDPANAGITIMGLAYDSGFNSKTTFNTTFKKSTGLTPKQFLKG